MNLKELKDKLNSEYKADLEYIESLEGKCIESVAEMVSHVNKHTQNCFFITAVDSITDVLNLISGHAYELESYYMSDYNSTLCVNYIIGEYKYVFYVKDYANALERISGGNCHIKEGVKKTLSVVCDSGGE